MRKNIYKLNMDYIFKVCRVHNVKDLEKVVQNGANMIGIHALFINRQEYLKKEKKYNPILEDSKIKYNLPIPTYEVKSIIKMQKHIPKSIRQALLFQQELDLESMKLCIQILKIPKENMYIQLHHRTTREYISKIKDRISKNIIAVVGAFQDDFREYFWYIHNALDKNNDFILIDLSTHQSDFSLSGLNVDKVERIKQIASIVKCNKIPIILAEDTDVDKMKNYIDILKKNNVFIRGIDMQNAVEIKKNKQKYEILKEDNEYYQIKIRKSKKLLLKWNGFIEKNKNKYFVG